MNIEPLEKAILDENLTLLSWKGLENLRVCLEDTIINNVPGDFIETGVWKGGACILAKYIFNQYNLNKKVFVADSFQGLPSPDVVNYPVDAGDIHYTLSYLSISSEMVRENFRRFDLLDDNVIFLEGWFKDTLPTAPIDKLSILRVDGDMYESTMQALDYLYPKLSVGGYCILDDWCLPRCRAAYYDYKNKIGIKENLMEDELAWWRKE
jgi:O-methyltransferase